MGLRLKMNKFRTWHNKTQQMVYEREMVSFINSDGDVMMEFPVYTQDRVVMDYTGVKDVDGNEVYEEDVLIDPTERGLHQLYKVEKRGKEFVLLGLFTNSKTLEDASHMRVLGNELEHTGKIAKYMESVDGIEESLVNRNYILGYRLESTNYHSYDKQANEYSFTESEQPIYDLKVVCTDRTYVCDGMTFGEAEEVTELLQDGLRRESDDNKITFFGLVNIISILDYRTYKVVLDNLLYKDDLELFDGLYYEWNPDGTNNCMTIKFSLAEGSLFDNYKNGLPLMEVVVYANYFNEDNEYALDVKLDSEGVAKAIKFINNHMERIAQDVEVGEDNE